MTILPSSVMPNKTRGCLHDRWSGWGMSSLSFIYYFSIEWWTALSRILLTQWKVKILNITVVTWHFMYLGYIFKTWFQRWMLDSSTHPSTYPSARASHWSICQSLLPFNLSPYLPAYQLCWIQYRSSKLWEQLSHANDIISNNGPCHPQERIRVITPQRHDHVPILLELSIFSVLFYK